MSAQRDVPATAAAAETWLLVEEISHRVANEYTAAIGSLSLAAARCANPDARIALVDAARRLCNHADVHRALQAPLVTGPAELALHLRALCGAMVRATLAERNIRLTLAEEPVALEAERCWRVGLIVCELIANAAHHGLARGGGQIAVTLAARDGLVHCSVVDDGTSRDPKPGRGTRILRALARELDGCIDWHFGARGTIALLSFPQRRRRPPMAG